MKVLLLGATGAVGSRALPALLKHGHQVVAFVRSPRKLTPAALAALTAVVTGSATDKSALKHALLAHNCTAVFHAAGTAHMFGRSTPTKGEYNAIFAAVVAAIVEARQERRGPPIRAWMMCGFPMLDLMVMGDDAPRLIGDYVPVFPEHRENVAMVRRQGGEDIAWSLFCAAGMSARHKEVAFPAPDDSSAGNVVAGADAPPEWSKTLQWVPLVGPYLNILSQAGGYATSIEDPVDFVAADFGKGLKSEFIGKRVGFKVKRKAS